MADTQPHLQPDTNPQNPTRPDEPACCCCSCKIPITFLATLFLLITILISTIVKVRDPILTLNNITIDKTRPGSGSNIPFTLAVSIKNPNPATFKFTNTTSDIYYGGILVGSARGLPGEVGSLRTLRRTIAVELMMDRVLGGQNLSSDSGSGLVTVESYTRVPGRVKMLLVVKEDVVVEMHCTVSFDVVSLKIMDQSCKRHVDFEL